MKLVRINELSFLEMQKFVKLQKLCVFHYHHSNIDITLFERQDDCLFVMVRDNFEQLTFYFQLFDDVAIDTNSFPTFRKVLLRLYSRFLYDYREQFLNLPF